MVEEFIKIEQETDAKSWIYPKVQVLKKKSIKIVVENQEIEVKIMIIDGK